VASFSKEREYLELTGINRKEQMDLIERIEELQVLIEEAKSVPLSSSAVINREEFLELLAQLKEGVPDEIRQARWMARDRDELLARARKEAERIVQEAAEQRDRLLSRTEIVHAAHREAERIVDESKERGARVRIEAEDYVDQKLAAFEILLNKTLATVAKGREQLRGEPRSHGADAPDGEIVQQPAQAPFDAAGLEQPA
jgi:cell division septum initiation protein DivIVA